MVQYCTAADLIKQKERVPNFGFHRPLSVSSFPRIEERPPLVKINFTFQVPTHLQLEHSLGNLTTLQRVLFMTNYPSTSDLTRRRKECEKKDNLRCCSCAATAIKARVPSPLHCSVRVTAARQTRRRGGGNAILMLPRHQNKPHHRR